MNRFLRATNIIATAVAIAALCATASSAAACNLDAQGPLYNQCLASSGRHHPQSKMEALSTFASCNRAANSLDKCSLTVSPPVHQALGAMLGIVVWNLALAERDLDLNSESLQYYSRARTIFEAVLRGRDNPDNVKAEVRNSLRDLNVELTAYQKELGIK